MPPPSSLSVSLVLYHSDLALLQETVESLAVAVSAARAAGVLAEAELLVVDHTPDPEYQEAARHLLTAASGADLSLVWIPVAGNPGFGAGHNRALARAGGEYFLVLNPDVSLAPDALAGAVTTLAEAPDIVLVAPRVAGAGAESGHLCKRYPSVAVLTVRALGWRWLAGLFRARLAAYEMHDLATDSGVQEVPLAGGCFMCLRSTDLRGVGGFDEAYFLYFEDFDLSLRLGQVGRVVLQPAVRVAHHGGYAARKGWRHIRLFAVSGRRFFARYGWRWL